MPLPAGLAKVRERSAKRGTPAGWVIQHIQGEDWSPKTVDRRIRSYGTFLHFARDRGQLQSEIRPALRASGPFLEDFIEHLEDRLEATSIATILSGMVAALRVVDPDGDTSVLKAAARHYERTAKAARDMSEILVGASKLYHAGIERMQRVVGDAETDPRAAAAYGDGLTIAMCTANPVRLKNLHATRVGVHLPERRPVPYERGFDPSETKNHQRIRAELPASLTPFLEHWLDGICPFLLRGQDHDAMWVTTRGHPMSRTTVYWRLCNATEHELGVRIYPHAIRHIAATSIAVSMPESVRMIPFILNNDDCTAQEHYNLADQLSASLQYLQRLETRRQRQKHSGATRTALATNLETVRHHNGSRTNAESCCLRAFLQ